VGALAEREKGVSVRPATVTESMRNGFGLGTSWVPVLQMKLRGKSSRAAQRKRDKNLFPRFGMANPRPPMILYFARLSLSKLILWCYLAWYAAIVAMYFDPEPMLWLSSLGMSAFIGIALNLATRRQGQPPDFWTTFRLFLIPFCVSSYSALIKGRGFVLLFPPGEHALLAGMLACAGMVAIHLACRAVARR